MKRCAITKIAVAFFLLSALCTMARGQAASYPPCKGFVSDYAGLLTSNQMTELTTLLSAYEQRTSAAVTVLIIDTIPPGKDIDAYATKLFNHWGIGKREKNNGLLFLVALKDRKVRLEVGSGLEDIISDQYAGEILDTRVIPRFKTGHYYEGIIEGAKAAMSRLDIQSKFKQDADPVKAEISQDGYLTGYEWVRSGSFMHGNLIIPPKSIMGDRELSALWIKAYRAGYFNAAERLSAEANAQTKACVNNLRQIAAAKRSYSLEQGKTQGWTWASNEEAFEELVGLYIKDFVLCPASTTTIFSAEQSAADYKVNPIGTDPECRTHPLTHNLRVFYPLSGDSDQTE